MQWDGDSRAFCDWCAATQDVDEFDSALQSVPSDAWPEVAECVGGALKRQIPPSISAPAESSAGASQEAGLTLEMRDWLEIHAEKLRLLEVESARR
jgi:hypothetical protein